MLLRIAYAVLLVVASCLQEVVGNELSSGAVVTVDPLPPRARSRGPPSRHTCRRCRTSGLARTGILVQSTNDPIPIRHDPELKEPLRNLTSPNTECLVVRHRHTPIAQGGS